MNDIPESATPLSRRSIGFRVLLIVVALGLGGALWWQRAEFSTESLIARETQLRDLYRREPGGLLAAGFVLYVLMTALSIPGASVLSLVFGWLFGFWPGLAVVSFASSLGATLACGLSRTLFREAAARRLGSRLQAMERSLARDGDFYLLTLRLLPQVPFFLINLALGLTNFPLWRFYLVSQVGMLPATAVFVYAGAQAVDLKTLLQQGPGSLLKPQLILALCLLAVVPWILRSVVRWWGRVELEAPGE
jgi:uncharacterized membrane protein YdjX (TVP38/TMEM64 family)